MEKKSDPVDYDGMGDFSRFYHAFDNGKSLENQIKDWFKEMILRDQKQ